MADVVKITAPDRYLRVLRADGSLLSRNLIVEDAIEAAVNAGPGAYDIVYPNRRVVVSKVYGTLPASPAPAAPTALTLEDVTAGYVSLSWTDDGNGTSWTVYRDGVPLGSVSSTAYTDSTVVPSTLYSYQVQASNSSGSSTLSDALAVTTSANSLPTWSLTDQSGTIGSSFALNLNTVCLDDDSHTLSYTLTSGSVPGLSLVSPNYTGTPTTAGAYPLTFQANDGYDTSDVSITFTVADPDVTAPTVPTGVSASANGSTVTVTWTASTDAANSVATYKIYRDGAYRASDTASPYVESGVPVGSYSYAVSAVDSSANANESAQSAAAPVAVVPQTPDTPINFTATSDGATTINLSWAAGPNGTAPDDYDLDFSATSASGPWTAITFVGTATTYAHTGRTAGVTYYYRVRAGLGAVESGYTAASATAGSSFTLIHDVGFEDGVFPPATELNTSGPGTDKTIRVDGTARLGTHHARFSLAKSVGTRIELASMTRDVLFCDTLTTPIPREQWLGMSVRLVNWQVDNATEEVLMQHHPNNAIDLNGNVQVLVSGDPGFEDWVGAPVCSLRTQGTNWLVNMRSTPYAPGDPLRPATGGSMNVSNSVTPWAADNNHWTDWVFHVVWDWRESGGTGLWEVWRRGQSTSGAWSKLVTYNGPTGINNWTNNWRGCMPYWKFGVYKSLFANSALTNRTAEFDAIKLIYDGGTFSDVAPSGSPA